MSRTEQLNREPPSLLYHHRTRAKDGQAVHVREMLEAFAQIGVTACEVSLVSHARETGVPSSTGGARFWRNITLPRTLTEVLELAYSKSGKNMLLRAGRESRYDLIYERYALHCKAGMLAARELALPFFLEVNAPIVDEMEKLGLLRFRRRAVRNQQEIFEAASRIFVVTTVLAELVEAMGVPRDRIVVTPNGARLDAYAAVRPRRRELRELFLTAQGLCDKTLLVFIGYPRAWHRLDLALRAIAELSQSHVDLHLCILGDGPAVPQLKELSRELDIEARCSFLAAYSREELPAIVSCCDIAIIPAMNSYASPLKLYDSLAAGLPTLAPDQANLREAVADGRHAFLFAAQEQGSFTKRLRYILEHRDVASQVGQAGRQHLIDSDRTWEANARAVVAEWQQVRKSR